MKLFAPTLSQMGVLGLYMTVGFVIAKLRVIPKESSKVLSKLENSVFLPALVLYTFLANFTVATLKESWLPLLVSLGIEIIIIPISIFVAKKASRDGFIQRMYTYGLCFSNFGFMGNAVVSALFPEIYHQYIIFTLPLWTIIYIWGVPGLLIEKEESENEGNAKGTKLLSALKSFVNPMFIALIIGAVIGVTGLGKIMLEANGGKGIFVTQVIKVLGDCMSPIAMLMTGITFAFLDFKKVLATPSLYAVTLLRLIVYPLVFGGAAWLVKAYLISIPDPVYISLICSLAMPLGLNTVVIPAAYGKDTSIPAGMALVSHVLSILTIPLVMMIFIH
ncbi:MAG: AEC family transporter [Clostridia bacterium]|nr:AEC family transporter [Clostridia bacterium]